jgi:hypothetical protein
LSLRLRELPSGWQLRMILLSYRRAREAVHQRQGVLYDLIRALPVAILVCFLPGWFWARLLLTSADPYVRVAFSVALSMALVPAVLLVPTRLFGAGVTLAAAVTAPLVVFLAGLLAYLRFEPAKGADEAPLVPLPPSPGTPALALLAAALALALGVVIGVLPRVSIMPPITVSAVPELRVLIAILVLVGFAGTVHVVEARREPTPPAAPGEQGVASSRPLLALARRLLMPAVLLLALWRGYAGPVLQDWPFIRGVDHYSHAVMAQLMMTEGKIEPYLIYPPGFHTMTAVVSRLSGLEPLEVFPVLAPLLLLLPALALYVLASRLWGWGCGVAAALFSVLLGGTYYYYNDAMYPNLVASQFLMVLAVAALVGTYASPPSFRGGLLLATLGSSVVLYHQVGSMYLAVVLALVGLLFVPDLLLRDRPKGVALLLSLALLGLLSILYAWNTYDLPQAVAGFLGHSSGSSSTGAAITMAVGTQVAYPLDFLLGNMVSQPVAWLGLLGVFLVAGELLHRRLRAPQALAYLTVLLWALLLFVGSRSPLTGFPQRFGRDLGVPLAVFAALAFVAVLRSLSGTRKQVAAVFVASLAVLAASTLVGVRTVSSLQSASGPSVQTTTTPAISAAGEWLRAHNSGGNIMVSPHANQVPSRMMLAMGGYPALQSFESGQIDNPRDLPPTGPGPLEDVLWVMTHPGGERTAGLLEKHDVRYIVLYKSMPDRPTRDYWKLFKTRPDLYRAVFENGDVLIVARRETASAG